MDLAGLPFQSQGTLTDGNMGCKSSPRLSLTTYEKTWVLSLYWRGALQKLAGIALTDLGPLVQWVDSLTKGFSQTF